MSTRNWLDLQTLGSQPIMPKNTIVDNEVNNHFNFAIYDAGIGDVKSCELVREVLKT